MKRFLRLAVWADLVWTVLTWTRTSEQVIFGIFISASVGAALSPLGDVVRPWSLLEPRRLWFIAKLSARSARRVVVANIRLARRIWSPSLPLESGMIVLPTQMRSDGELAAVGLITSLIVDNQIVDLDRPNRLLQYHAVSVPKGSSVEKAAAVNRPVEELLKGVSRTGRDA